MAAPIELTNIKLQYFPIAGRGEPIRYMLEDAGVAYEEAADVQMFRDGKFDYEQYRFNQLPRLTVNGTHLFQQGAILRFLAKAKGYTGSGDIFQDTLVDQLQDACEDLNVAYVSKIYAPNGPELLLTFIKEHVPKVLKQFDYIFSKNQQASGYLAYEKPSFAEFHLLYLFHALSHLNPALLEAFPTLKAWNERMLARPGLKAYFESGRMKTQLNGNDNGQKAIV
ncbi:hypothetical protein JCM10213_003218 [Rhodosporidiobolus nylandii]